MEDMEESHRGPQSDVRCSLLETSRVAEQRSAFRLLRNLMEVLFRKNEEVHINIVSKDARERREPRQKNKLMIEADWKSFGEMVKDLKENLGQEQVSIKFMKKKTKWAISCWRLNGERIGPVSLKLKLQTGKKVETIGKQTAVWILKGNSNNRRKGRSLM